MSAASPPGVLHLYRHILKAAKYFPSKKRTSIIREIKEEFRSNKTLSDPDRIAHCRVLAERGLSDLQAYVPAGAGAGAGAGGHTHSMLGGDISITLKGATTQSW
ncbi:hypothetical protein CHLRE_13g578800v5 [Chlamydomonas reinhardtii]|uniref:Complex 1 LYR protein domain-containing protein n=1 Tax=Chlamydomonas reinhardtii TaxID=3055 RepID=A8HTL0_CHLRE|nr:uncharacterized protein CHLRE_13g578800v5 [Chlamydomonas reinhardtii]PNW73934.1 hypothetical protein CHLRE_13g578800v5 [Chlamydomonas reinhardtii]|eukprot:XP_001693795.1 predicted protein [Chlamydomonas reinhardtii]